MFGRIVDCFGADNHHFKKVDDAAEDGDVEEFVALSEGAVGFDADGDGVVLFADGDGNVVGGAHHDAFDDGLAADGKIDFRGFVRKAICGVNFLPPSSPYVIIRLGRSVVVSLHLILPDKSLRRVY